MQPYFFPYIGYFQLISAVDKYIIYDDVNYIKGGWINRNNILVDNQKHLFTITLDQASPYKLINEIFIKDNFSKLKKTISLNYVKAPYFQKSFPLIESILSNEEKNLGRFVSESIMTISSFLGIKTEFIISSTLHKNNNLKNVEKVLHICDLMGASKYINAIGGKDLYDKEEFAKHNVELNFLKTKPISYKQFNDQFVPGLSIIDVIMFNSTEKIVEMLKLYELI
jgi:WbqC-like protein family